VITFSNRQVQGTQTFDAPRAVVLTDVPTGREKLVITLTLEPADLVNPALSLTMSVWASFDGGVTFPQRVGRATWRGGPGNIYQDTDPDTDQPITVTMNPIKLVVPVLLATLLGVRLRGEITTSARMRLSGGVFVRVPLADE
jgi:hypothetical protein